MNIKNDKKMSAFLFNFQAKTNKANNRFFNNVFFKLECHYFVNTTFDRINDVKGLYNMSIN